MSKAHAVGCHTKRMPAHILRKMYCRHGDASWLEHSAIPKRCLISKCVFMKGIRCWYGIRLVLWSFKVPVHKQEFIFYLVYFEFHPAQ